MNENLSNQKAIVSSLGNNNFRVTFPKKLSAEYAFLLTGSHQLSIVLSKSKKYADAFEGTRENILLWLKSLPGITEEAMKSFEHSMEE